MGYTTWAARIVIPTGLLVGGPAGATEPGKYLSNTNLMPPRLIALHVELAGAEDGDEATPEQLKRSGTNMVPSEDLKQAKPLLQPTPGENTGQPEKPAVMPVKSEPPQEKPMTPAPIADPQPPKEMEMVSATDGLAAPYLRLDAGYAFHQDSDGTQSAGALTSESVGNATVWGGGIGYRFDDNLRADVTFAYRPDANVGATTAAGNTTSSEVSALSVMANAYWDFATIDKFTPYVGAGIGYAHLDTSDQTTTGGVATETGATSNNFAWSLQAGAAYQVIENTSLDVNYRFINLGEFSQKVSTSFDDLMSHEVRAGLRVKF